MFSTNLRRACPLNYISKRSQTTFQQILTTRRHEADCTVLVESFEGPSIKHQTELAKYCSKFGKLSRAFWFVKNRGNGSYMYLLRFETPNAASALLEATPYKMTSRGSIPTKFRQLVFTPTKQNTKGILPLQFEKQDLSISTDLKEAASISEQMQLIYEAEKQTEFDVSMRFFICHQIENILRGVWGSAAVLPFGSSINSFGRRPSDLDMAISLNYDLPKPEGQSCLHYVDLGQQMTEWSHAKDIIPKLAELLRLVPVFERPNYILARVPILTFRHRSLHVECDLSLANLSGLYMSELLYTMAELDPRVRPMVFAIRCWAKENQITRPRPSHTPSSFMLTMLTVFFLQQEKVVPPLSLLLNDQNPHDIAYLDINPHINILKKNIKWNSTNTDNLETLMGKFLDYYSTFPFDSKGICVVRGKQVPKVERCAMYMVNPLNPGLNASKNVNYAELGKMVKKLQAHARHFQHLEGPQQSSNWGFSKLLSPHILTDDPPTGPGFQVSSLYVEDQRRTKAS